MIWWKVNHRKSFSSRFFSRQATRTPEEFCFVCFEGLNASIVEMVFSFWFLSILQSLLFMIYNFQEPLSVN